MRDKCQCLFDKKKMPWIWIYTVSKNFAFLVNISEHRTSSGTLFCFEIPLTLRSAVTPRLIHWGQVTHICVGDLTIIVSDNGLLPGRHQAIIWTNDEIFLIESLGTNFSEILIEIQTFSLKNIHLKMLSAKCCRFRLGLNVLNFFSTGNEISFVIFWSLPSPWSFFLET